MLRHETYLEVITIHRIIETIKDRKETGLPQEYHPILEIKVDGCEELKGYVVVKM